MSPDPLEMLARLHDERSGRVVFVSHCLLNENTRYAGGAVRPGAVSELVAELVRSDAGICQMPCPEHRAWGGVIKRDMLRAYGSNGSPLYSFRSSVLRGFAWWTEDDARRLSPCDHLGSSIRLPPASTAYRLLGRPCVMTCGASEEKASSRPPGDELVEGGDEVATRAIAIRAPASAVWPWLVQTGPAPEAARTRVTGSRTSEAWAAPARCWPRGSG